MEELGEDIIDPINPAEVEAGYRIGFDGYAKDPAHLMRRFGEEKAIEMLRDPANRTPPPPGTIFTDVSRF